MSASAAYVPVPATHPIRRSVCSLRAATKSYQLGTHVVHAVKSVDLDAMPGEMVALTGPSGSGKSTLLNLCGLIDTLDAGEYRFENQDVTALSERERALLRRASIGFVFQSFNLVPVMSVADNVDYPLMLAGLNASERRRETTAILARVGLESFATRRPDELSGGQRQRVAIARALVKRPRLVIADEPTANLDSHTAEQMLVLLRELAHAQSSACLIATHDQRLVARCDRVLEIRDGVLQ